ncbi:MAG: hypothetical protein PVI30_04220 [Myxococcales bacterium]|jgi:hypothetical protein
MTSIKPPDGRSPVSGTPGDGPRAEGPTGGPSFREVAATDAQEVTQDAAGAVGADPVAQLAEAVRSGQLSPDQAIDQLVERTAAQLGDRLDAGRRAELTAVLRDAIDSDPVLAELRDAFSAAG